MRSSIFSTKKWKRELLPPQNEQEATLLRAGQVGRIGTGGSNHENIHIQSITIHHEILRPWTDFNHHPPFTMLSDTHKHTLTHSVLCSTEDPVVTCFTKSSSCFATWSMRFDSAA